MEDPKTVVMERANLREGAVPITFLCQRPKILKACYGKGTDLSCVHGADHNYDMTAWLQRRVSDPYWSGGILGPFAGPIITSLGSTPVGDGTWNSDAKAAHGGDPWPGTTKNLRVRYSCFEACLDNKNLPECSVILASYCGGARGASDSRCGPVYTATPSPTSTSMQQTTGGTSPSTSELISSMRPYIDANNSMYQAQQASKSTIASNQLLIFGGLALIVVFVVALAKR
eukprot:tig00000681_g3148.t1